MRFTSRSSLIKFVYILIDVACVYCAIFLACKIRQAVLLPTISFRNFWIDQTNPYHVVFQVWILTTVFFANAHHLYQTRREMLEGLEIWMVVKAVTLSSLVTVVAIFALKLVDFPRTVFLIAAVTMTGLMLIWRVFKRWFVEYIVSRGYNNFHALIVGTGKVAVALAEEIKKRPALGIKVVGFLDEHLHDRSHHGIKIIGKISDFERIAQREFVNQVYITFHHDSAAFINLLEKAQEMGIAIKVVPQGFDLIIGEIQKSNIGLVPILEYSDILALRKQTGKRLFDFILSAIFSLLSLPLFVLIGILIKLDSPGPIFYVSRRYGKSGRIFGMYKFRTMVREADKLQEKLKHKNEVDGPIFKMKGDPRVTRAGKILRKYSLDEMPQLFNVFKGEMSLVGPRPLPIEQIEKEDLRQFKRLNVRPGITGLWQIRGRSDISFNRLLKWDIWYINNWSFWLDLNILLQTVPVVFKGRGAY